MSFWHSYLPYVVLCQQLPPSFYLFTWSKFSFRGSVWHVWFGRSFRFRFGSLKTRRFSFRLVFLRFFHQNIRVHGRLISRWWTFRRTKTVLSFLLFSCWPIQDWLRTLLTWVGCGMSRIFQHWSRFIQTHHQAWLQSSYSQLNTTFPVHDVLQARLYQFSLQSKYSMAVHKIYHNVLTCVGQS